MSSVLIVVPTFDSIEPDTFKSIYGLKKPDGCNVMFDFIRGYDVARARNLIVREALQFGFDYLLMVDSDIVLPRDALTMLLSIDKDIVLGWYPRKRSTTGQTELFALGHSDFVDTNNINVKDIQGDAPVEIKGGGLGCALIKTSVFTTLGCGPWFKYVEYESGDVLSEDNYFCDVATKCGFKIYYHPQVRCGHVNKVIF